MTQRWRADPVFYASLQSNWLVFTVAFVSSPQRSGGRESEDRACCGTHCHPLVLLGVAEENVAISALQGPPCSPCSLSRQLPPGCATWKPALAQPWGRGGQSSAPSMAGGQWAANSPGTVGFFPCAGVTVVKMKSPWNSTGTPNLQVRGMGDVERGAVLQAGVLINMLVIAKVLFPQSSTTFYTGLFKAIQYA